jgi:hypothetical protein
VDAVPGEEPVPQLHDPDDVHLVTVGRGPRILPDDTGAVGEVTGAGTTALGGLVGEDLLGCRR